MAARTRAVRPGRQAGRFVGRDPRALPVSPPIAGNPPQSILDSTLGDPAREKGERMHPLGFAFAVRQPSRAAPANPFVANFPMLSNSVRGLGLSAATERRLQTLPTMVQDAFQDAIAGAQEPQTDESYARIMDAYNVLAATPGAPSFEDLAPLARALEATTPPTTITEEEREEARASIMGGGGTEAPEPTEEQILQEAANIRSNEAVDGALIIPTRSAEPYAPAEDYFEQITGED